MKNPIVTYMLHVKRGNFEQCLYFDSQNTAKSSSVEKQLVYQLPESEDGFIQHI